jgi:hypothetical protein
MRVFSGKARDIDSIKLSLNIAPVGLEPGYNYLKEMRNLVNLQARESVL